MTPMIDIVFQLIVFFMLVMDLSAAKIEIMTLPFADTAFKDKSPDPNQVIVNILKTGDVKIDGKFFYRHKNKDNPLANKRLEDFFLLRKRMTQYWSDASGKSVNYPVLIRADRSTEFIHVQKIMMIGSAIGGVYRIEFGATMPSSD